MFVPDTDPEPDSKVEFLDLAVMDSLFKYLRREYEDESVQFFDNLEKIESLSTTKIEPMIRYIFKRVLVCDCSDAVMEIFVVRSKHLKRDRKVLAEIESMQKNIAALHLLRYYQFYTTSKAMEVDSWLVDEKALIPLDPEKYNAMEKCLSEHCIGSPIGHAFTAKGWARAFIETVLELPVAVSIADARTFENPGFPLIYVNKHFEMLTGYNRQYCLGKNCKFLQFFPTTMKKSLKLRKKITTSAANISSLDDPEIEHPDGKISFLVSKDYEKVREYFPKEEFFQEPVEEDQTFVVEQMSEALKAGNPFICIVQNYRSDGSKYLCLLCLRPLFGSDGKYAFVVGLHYDVTALVDPHAPDEPIDWDSRPGSPSNGAALDGRVAGSHLHLVHDHYDHGLKINNEDGEDSPDVTPRMEPERLLSGGMMNGLLFNKSLSSREDVGKNASAKARATQAAVFTASGKVKAIGESSTGESGDQEDPDMSLYTGINPDDIVPESETSSPAKSIRGHRIDYTLPGSVVKFVYLVLMFSKIFPRLIPRVAVGVILKELHLITTDQNDKRVADLNAKSKVIGTAASNPGVSDS